MSISVGIKKFSIEKNYERKSLEESEEEDKKIKSENYVIENIKPSEVT